ncbi:redoxin domain-containing protein [Paracrocinitomix mangrovi]|uniref:redoxin domain-containing protein n=1 Tax=Paracrocinitomix mangrovi TaxID=2862509 RepID=UPI001C8DF3F8|nr:redoxin domain-containing protein [Paracrocinitomix mangrovi]UKN02665.1 redoxin domain-containing protein [Paracrocinitomix mangrovi]
MSKKLILVLVAMIASLGVSAQNLKFEVKGLKDTTIFLANYMGSKLYYADTTESKNGIITFDGSKQPTGLYAVITPGMKYFEFILDNNEKEVHMTTTNSNNFIAEMEVKKSENNKIFYDYIFFMTKYKQEGQKISEEYEKADEKRKEEIKEEMKKMGDVIREEQTRIWNENKDKFVGKMVWLSSDMKLPEAPKDENGVIQDSNYVYNYYIAHYWDGIDFKDPSLVRSPVYHNKLDKYFSDKGLVQVPDSIIKYARIMIDQMDWKDEDNKVFQYTVHHITSKYEKSKIMGMDKVFVYMGQNFYCDPNNYAYWMTEENTDKLCERVDKLGGTIIGNPAPMVILTDSTEKKWINSHKIDAKYTVLYFWDPDCGHCKKTTPKLQTLYEKKFKDRDVEIYAIGKATGEDFEKWKKFIRDNNLTFINVGLTQSIYNIAMENPAELLKYTTIQSLNYTDTWDIYSTPRIFVMDENKILRFKGLAIWQLEEIIDNLTGHKDDPKIFTEENSGTPDHDDDTH